MGCYYVKLDNGQWSLMYDGCSGNCGTPPPAGNYSTGAIVFVDCA